MIVHYIGPEFSRPAGKSLMALLLCEGDDYAFIELLDGTIAGVPRRDVKYQLELAPIDFKNFRRGPK